MTSAPLEELGVERAEELKALLAERNAEQAERAAARAAGVEALHDELEYEAGAGCHGLRFSAQRTWGQGTPGF